MCSIFPLHPSTLFFYFQMPLGESCGNNPSRDYVPCGTCGTQFRTEEQLQKHKQLCGKRSMGPLNNQKCQQTRKVETTKYKGSETVQECGSQSDTPYNCTLCGMDFELKCVYLGHKKTHTENEKLQTTTDKGSETMHECVLCQGEFQSKKALTTHRRMCWRKMHKCPCGKEFGKRKALLGHQSGVPKGTQYKCTVCGIDFELKCVYLGHNKTHTENEKLQTTTDQGSETMHKCGLCQGEFQSKEGLKTHRRMCCRKMHKCPCGKAFGKKKTLLSHQSSVSKDTSYKCTLCGMDFELKCVYLVHEESHTE